MDRVILRRSCGCAGSPRGPGSAVNRTVMPGGVPTPSCEGGSTPTSSTRTEAEVERLMEAAKGNRWGLRDSTMILVAYRHGLRVSELVDLRWDQVDFETATLHVRRVKKGTPATHPVLGDELRALRRLQREQEPKSTFVFTSERGAPFTTAGFARMVERAGSEAKLGFKRGSRTSGGAKRAAHIRGRDEEACKGFSRGGSNGRNFRDTDPRVRPVKREPHHTAELWQRESRLRAGPRMSPIYL